MKQALVTGAAGFIGSHLCAALIGRGYRVIGLDDLSGGFRDNVPEAVEFIEGSVEDHLLIQKIFTENKINTVCHLAAYAAEGLSHFIKRFNYNNNLIGSINLINESVKHDIECFLFTSSIAVYGANQLPMREDMTPVPEDSYGIAKYAVELELAATQQMFGLDHLIFRPHNVYGEHQNIGDRYRNVIGIFMNQIMQGLPLTIFGDGEQTRAFSYISDVVEPMADMLTIKACYNQTFNIGADKPYSINSLIQEIGKCMHKKPTTKFLDARNEVKHAYADHEKIKQALGARESVSLTEGLSRMSRWAIKTGARKSKTFANIEIEKNLPPVWKE